mgnify:CR=1 FL=1
MLFHLHSSLCPPLSSGHVAFDSKSSQTGATMSIVDVEVEVDVEVDVLVEVEELVLVVELIYS